jgi:hypothetical protein
MPTMHKYAQLLAFVSKAIDVGSLAAIISVALVVVIGFFRLFASTSQSGYIVPALATISASFGLLRAMHLKKDGH